MCQSSAHTMKEMSCFCLTFSSLLEQMGKAYKYVTGIFSVTHSSEPQVSDGDKELTGMDVSILEEQYDHIKQKQKLQPHIIVYKTGGHESLLPESIINPVLINKNVKRSKSGGGDVPVRKATLVTMNAGDSEDNFLWRVHLGNHRLGQALGQGDSCHLSHCNSPPRSFDNQRLISMRNDTPQTKEPAGASELSELGQLGRAGVLNSLGKENDCNISSSCQKPPLKSPTAALHQKHSRNKPQPPDDLKYKTQY
ncbi:hypothetical protein DV515_00001323 [Chloebia gouldiae]|uniref:TBC1 domain-containing protein n=1 Tax=Chloebia gouldiae TaxID=44316 RepID=A0A3L8SZI4_CHLGU|nr:hypothetical protein DV515_00001323 [Chloebia gouldiae]